MFYVYNKEPSGFEKSTGHRVRILVYSVQYKSGYPFFTFYEDGQWVTRSAKHYVPANN